MKKQYSTQSAKGYDQLSDHELIDEITKNINPHEQETIKAILEKRLKRSLQYLTEIIKKNIEKSEEYNELFVKVNKTNSLVAIITSVLSLLMLVVAIITLFYTHQALKVAENNLKLVIDPQISITPFNNNEFNTYTGFIEAPSSTAQLVLYSNNLVKIKDVQVWADLIDLSLSENRKISACPSGYFTIASNTLSFSKFVSNVLPPKLAPSENGDYIFNINFDSINNENKNAEKIIKLDITYTREIDGKQFNYTKILFIFNQEYLVDTDMFKTVYGFIGKNKQIVISDELEEIELPTIIHPLKREIFVNTLKTFKRPYSFLEQDCKIFNFSENNEINS